jgi:hypothetical protein
VVNGPQAGWGNTDELLFSLIELVRLWRHEWLIAHGAKPDELQALRRPWEQTLEVERPRMSSREEMRSFFKGEVSGTTKVIVSQS